MAEKIFNCLSKEKGIKSIKAISAGLLCENGVNMEIKSKRALKQLGYNCGAKKSLQLKTLEKDTLYITMTDEIKLSLKSNRVVSFKDLGLKEIADPYGADQNVYNETAKNIESNILNLIERLKNLIK